MSNYVPLIEAIAKLDEELVLKIVKKQLQNKDNDPNEAVIACQDGLKKVGELFESGTYFIGDLIFAGELMSEIMEIIKPKLLTNNKKNKIGKVLICTVEGDIHDLGKNIVKNLMVAAGIEVQDLGIDVQADEIVKNIIENEIKIIGLSGVLTFAIDSMKKTIDAIKEKGIRDKVKIIIGGAAVNADYCKYVDADAWTRNAAEGVSICRKWIS